VAPPVVVSPFASSDPACLARPIVLVQDTYRQCSEPG